MKPQEMVKEEFEAGAFPYLNSLYQMSFCLTRNESKAAELVQQTYLKSYQFCKQTSTRADYRKLLLKSLAEIFLHGLPDSASVEKKAPEYNTVRNDIEEESFSLDSVPCSILRKAIASVPADIRLMIILSIHWGLSYREIAEITDIDLEVVRVKMRTGRLRLRTLLVDRLLETENQGRLMFSAN
jgi:RNA polymerase sigma-70 factor (ECF subfamily)